MAIFADRLRFIDTENAFKIGPRIREVEAEGHRVIRCNIGEPDFPLAPHIRDEVKRQLDDDNTHYSDPQGLLSLRTAIAEQIGATRKLAIDPAQVVVFPGAKPAIGLSQQAYTNPGDEVVYPSPGFPIYESFIAYLGAVPVPLHLDETRGFSLTGAELAPLLSERTKMIFLNFPSNPTGGVADRSQLEEIAAVILERAPTDVRVFSDEVYEHILFDGAEHHSIASIPGMAERTVIVSGVSKSYCWTGGRLGWAVFPSAAEAGEFRNLNINYFSCMPAYNQEGARLAIESPASEPAIAHMCRAFQKRRDVVVRALNAIDGIRCQTPRGAFYVFPNIAGMCDALGAVDAFDALPGAARQRSSPATLVQLFLLYRYHVATMDRRSFGRIGADGRHYLRLSIATALEDLEDAVSRIADAARDRAGFASFMREGRTSY